MDSKTKRVMKPIVELENGALYQGEWNDDQELRDGRGV
jgi:hypothetical protein